MNKKELEDYQRSLKPWIPKCDVTMVDVVVCGLVDDVIYIVDGIIFKMIASN
jgi:hypothetical protein